MLPRVQLEANTGDVIASASNLLTNVIVDRRRRLSRCQNKNGFMPHRRAQALSSWEGTERIVDRREKLRKPNKKFLNHT